MITLNSRTFDQLRYLLALLEVVLAFVVVHVGYRALKYFTVIGSVERERGTNFTPGVVMIVFTVAVLSLCGRSFADYGITLNNWRQSLKVGLVWGVLIVGGAALLIAMGVEYKSGKPPEMRTAVYFGLALVATITLIAWAMKKQRRFLEYVPATLCVGLCVCVVLMPLAVSWYQERSIVDAMLSVAWLVIGAGIGEEIFFRAYIQSRINETFKRPWRVGGLIDHRRNEPHVRSAFYALTAYTTQCKARRQIAIGK